MIDLAHSRYTAMSSPDSNRRAELASLSRAARAGVVGVEEAAAVWKDSRRGASLRLARLARAGWLSRVRRGVYFIAPLDAGGNVVAEDPWVLAHELFAPAYIGGWTAAEHWGLTEQLFRETFVATAANIREREQTKLGVAFRLVRVPLARVASVHTIWRGSVRVRVSNAERTLIDGCIDPSWVGGVRPLVEMLASYRDSANASPERLAKELTESNSGAAHKRLGLIVERIWPEATRLIDAAARGRTAGVIRLDPAIASQGKMSRRWGLWVNATVPERAE